MLKDRIGNTNVDTMSGFEIEGIIEFSFTSAPDVMLQDIDYVNSMQSYLQSVPPDCQINLQGNIGFRCHSCILKGRSEVIKIDLEKYRGFHNADGGFICITSPNFMTSAGVNALLRYLYYRDTEDMRNNAKVAFELLQAADYYLIRGLTIDSVGILKQTIAAVKDADTLIDLFKFLRLKEDLKELRTLVGQTIKT
jgi:hypothetical protein